MMPTTFTPEQIDSDVCDFECAGSDCYEYPYHELQRWYIMDDNVRLCEDCYMRRA